MSPLEGTKNGKKIGAACVALVLAELAGDKRAVVRELRKLRRLIDLLLKEIA